MPREKSFLARVRQAMAGLNPAERKLAEMLCDFPGELASYSAAELAPLAGVSAATVSRFVRRLGYASYEQARLHARRERETGSRLYLATRNAGDDDPLQAHFHNYAKSLERTAAALDVATLDAIVAALLNARRVWAVGFRASHAFATYLRWQLLQVIEHVDAIPGGGQTLGEHLVSVAAKDVVVLFGLRRRVSQTEAIIEEILRRGTKLVYITDESVAFRSDVTWHLRCDTSSPGPLFSHVAVMAICHLIVDQAIARAGRSAKDRLRDIEAIHDALSEV